MKKILSSVLISFSLLSIPVLGHTFTCQEYKINKQEWLEGFGD